MRPAVRVVVTGLGVICSNGCNVRDFWGNISGGRSGIKTIHSISTADLMTEFGGEITGFSPTDHFSKKQLGLMDICGQYAVVAAREAVHNAKLSLETIDRFRVGLVVGTSLGGMRSGEAFHRQWIQKGLKKANTALLLTYPIHTAADNVAHDLGITGPRTVISNACAAGTNAIGFAFELICDNRVDCVLAGGVDPLSLFSFAGFNSLKALSKGPCSPYSKSEGLSIGEGAGFLMLESLEHAQQRGAEILSEVLGYSLSADAYHQTAPDPGGSGAIRAMSEALVRAGVSVEELSYINGHGTGTPSNDLSEPKAIRSVIRREPIPISSTKSMTGHALGAAGAIEAVISVLAIKSDIVPPTANFHAENANFDMDFVPNESRSVPLENVLSNSFAFGGNNASIVFGKLRDRSVSSVEQNRIVISGVGVLAAGAVGIKEFYERLLSQESQVREVKEFLDSEIPFKLGGKIPAIPYGKWINPIFLRRMDSISKMAVATSRQALDDADIRTTRDSRDHIGVIFATGTGPIETVESFHRVIVEQGVKAANANLFPNTVMNAAAGHIGLNFKLKGPTSTLTTGGVSLINALLYAQLLLKNRVTEQMLVVSSDELNVPLQVGYSRIRGSLTNEALRPFDEERCGTNLAEASTAFLLETLDSARRRGARIYAEVCGFGMTSDSYRISDINPQGVEWEESFRKALADAGIVESEADLVVGAANGHRVYDLAEAAAIYRVFGQGIPVTAPKGMFGETSGSAGGINVLTGLFSLNGGVIPSICGLRRPLREFALDYVVDKNRKQDVQTVLISSFSTGGNYQSLVLKTI